jgi:hypothetical protein
MSSTRSRSRANDADRCLSNLRKFPMLYRKSFRSGECSMRGCRDAYATDRRERGSKRQNGFQAHGWALDRNGTDGGMKTRDATDCVARRWRAPQGCVARASPLDESLRLASRRFSSGGMSDDRPFGAGPCATGLNFETLRVPVRCLCTGAFSFARPTEISPSC